MTKSGLISLLGAGALLALATPARADRADDLARIHIEALGGRDRIAALSAMRATGYVLSAGQRVRFVLTAARPNRLRLETGAGGRTLVQASDGVEPAWQFDTGTWPPRYVAMAENLGKTFAGDAEFDDALVAGAARGYAFEYGGETVVDGKKLLRVAVTRKPGETYSVLLDTETYLIVLRVEKRGAADGRSILSVTRYEDYRPVDGVLLPHRVTVITDGKATQQTVIESIVPNPELTAETFTRPKAAAPAAKE